MSTAVHASPSKSHRTRRVPVLAVASALVAVASVTVTLAVAGGGSDRSPPAPSGTPAVAQPDPAKVYRYGLDDSRREAARSTRAVRLSAFITAERPLLSVSAGTPKCESPPTAALVGREAELLALREAFAAGRTPVGRVCSRARQASERPLCGSPASRRPRSSGCCECSARSLESEVALSHAALGDLLAPLVGEAAEDIPAPQRHALDVALLRAAPGTSPVDPRAVGAGTSRGAPRSCSRRSARARDRRRAVARPRPPAGALAFALRRLGRRAVVVLARRSASARERSPLDLGLAEERTTRIGVAIRSAGGRPAPHAPAPASAGAYRGLRLPAWPRPRAATRTTRSSSRAPRSARPGVRHG